MNLKGFLIIVSILVIAAVAVLVFYGPYRWRAETRELRAKLREGRSPTDTQIYNLEAIANLPDPVRRYFQKALKNGQPVITGVDIEHVGTFNFSETGEQWRPFRSTQRVVPRRPGFLWDARISMAPGLTVFVRDAYVAGRGILTAKLFGFLTVMEQPETPELDQGELMRFLAEAAWYPTALLPGQGVSWEAIDDTTAAAELTDGETTVRLIFEFDAEGAIASVRSEGRFREVGGELVATPWVGRFWDYELRDGMMIPQRGEVAWLLSEGPQPYWRGRIRRIEYEYTRPAAEI